MSEFGVFAFTGCGKRILLKSLDFCRLARKLIKVFGSEDRVETEVELAELLSDFATELLSVPFVVEQSFFVVSELVDWQLVSGLAAVVSVVVVVVVGLLGCSGAGPSSVSWTTPSSSFVALVLSSIELITSLILVLIS